MISNNQPKSIKILFVVFAILLVVGIFMFLRSPVTTPQITTPTTPTPETNTPTEATSTPWETITSNTGITYQYPKTLPTTYIHPVDWPPQVQVLNQPYSCTEGGSEIARAGVTTQRTINDRTYCVTKESEGAAGSIYTNYAYAFPLYSTSSTQADPPSPNGSEWASRRIAIFTFSIRSVQCANYDNPKMSGCENERAIFNIDEIIDRIARSMRVPPSL